MEVKLLSQFKTVLVTGSRGYANRDLVFSTLCQAMAPFGLIIEGGCPSGADLFAREWARTQGDIHHASIAAKWESSNAFRSGNVRNGVMVALKPQLVLAYFQPGEKNVGTQDCVDQAENAGLDIISFNDEWVTWTNRMDLVK